MKFREPPCTGKSCSKTLGLRSLLKWTIVSKNIIGQTFSGQNRFRAYLLLLLFSYRRPGFRPDNCNKLKCRRVLAPRCLVQSIPWCWPCSTVSCKCRRNAGRLFSRKKRKKLLTWRSWLPVVQGEQKYY